MYKKEGIAIGGVIAEVAWLRNGDTPVPENELLIGLCNRFGVEIEHAMHAVELAETCGVIEKSKRGIVLKPRPF